MSKTNLEELNIESLRSRIDSNDKKIKVAFIVVVAASVTTLIFRILTELIDLNKTVELVFVILDLLFALAAVSAFIFICVVKMNNRKLLKALKNKQNKEFLNDTTQNEANQKFKE